ncbi:hypothetical protein KW783_00950 [Candidatus Parcubacteria bacterium]|nr:hypothetical protein [Candidatus Parcubacteria bacterium]
MQTSEGHLGLYLTIGLGVGFLLITVAIYRWLRRTIKVSAGGWDWVYIHRRVPASAWKTFWVTVGCLLLVYLVLWSELPYVWHPFFADQKFFWTLSAGILLTVILFQFPGVARGFATVFLVLLLIVLVNTLWQHGALKFLTSWSSASDRVEVVRQPAVRNLQVEKVVFPPKNAKEPSREIRIPNFCHFYIDADGPMWVYVDDREPVLYKGGLLELGTIQGRFRFKSVDDSEHVVNIFITDQPGNLTSDEVRRYKSEHGIW